MRIHYKKSFLAALLLALIACRDRAEKLFADAKRAVETDEIETAARLYQEITIQIPDSPLAADAYYELAQIYYLRLRDVDAAKNSLIKVLHDHPDADVNVDAKRLLARLYEEDLQEPERAMKLYRTLLADDLEENARRQTLLDVAHCHYRMGQLEASANAYRLALGLPYQRETDRAYMRLAYIEWLNGSPQESLHLLRELAERTTDEDRRHEAMLTEVEVLMSLGEFGAARRRIDEAGERFRDSRDVLELEERLEAIETAHQSLAGEGEEALLQELQKKIRWGAGRRRRRAQ